MGSELGNGQGSTALAIAQEMNLPSYARRAIGYGLHPQERTLAFHHFFGAPVRSQRPDREFSHMSDERVAFRAAFILSEAFELLEKGLGLKLSLNIEDDAAEGEAVFLDVHGPEFCKLLAWHLSHGMGKDNRDLVEVADALGDLNVVVNGFAIELGIDMQVVDREVCASNFTKAGEDGLPIIGDGTNGPVGKVLKGPNFVEPQLGFILCLSEETENVG